MRVIVKWPLFYVKRKKMPLIKYPFPPMPAELNKKAAARILLKSVIYAFAIFGILFILLLFAVLGLLGRSVPVAAVPQNAVLTIDFDEAVSETRRDTLLTEVAPTSGLAFYELLTVLGQAAFDDRIKAVAGRINVSSLGLAQMQELFNAVQNFKKSGKPAYIYSSGFGSLGGGTAEYYLASAFSKITMQPHSELGITGIYAEVPFFRPLLDKLGVSPEFFSRYEYKNAMASFTDKKISEAFRKEMAMTVDSFNIILGRGMLEARFAQPDKDELWKIYDKAPFSAEYAQTIGLVDELAFESDWLDNIKEKHQAELISATEYASTISFNTRGSKLALLILEGTITDVPGINPLGDGEINARAVLEQIDEIKADKDVKGVVVRINSPGGSYTASAEIWNALNRLKAERKIPLIVSMGDYAASGGYFVALAGDRIFADMATLTGSIGVLGGKFALEKLWEKLNVNWALFATSPNAGILSSNTEFTKEQKEAINKSLDRIYEDFTLKVSQARNISPEKMDELARGRVFTGLLAVSNGLIDQIGGLDAAISELKQKAGLKADEPYVLAVYPKPKSLQEKIGELLSSAPVVSMKSTAEKLGLDVQSLYVLKHLQYDAVMPPMIIRD